MQNKYMIGLLTTLTLTLIMLIYPIHAKAFKINPLVKSALIPGWGQVSIDRPYGYAMIAGEVLLWSVYYYNHNEQDLRDKESYEYALKFAHINPGSYDSQYYTMLSKYGSSSFDAGGYNAMIRKQAMELFPNDLILRQQYIDENAIPDELSWYWDSTQDRKNFSTMRKDILELKDQAQLITGIIIANHILSSIDMLRLKRKWSPLKSSLSYKDKTLKLNLSLEF